MIIKSHIRGGYRAAAQYMKDIGQNEKTRLVHISDPDAKNLDEAFHNMWTVASNSKAKKPLHHISINPFKDERLTDEQVMKIIQRCEQKYGYLPDEHQRVIVEHIKDGRQHFHVIWNRVNLGTGKAVWPGMHWNKSKQAAREMERELGLKTPVPRRIKKRQFKLSSFREGKKSLTRRAAPGQPSMTGKKIVLSSESKQTAPTTYKKATYRKGEEDRKFTPYPKDIEGREPPSGRAEIAYKVEFDKWRGLIDAAANDQSVPKDQRLANVAALRIRQKAAAKAARKRAIEEEKSTVQARRLAQRALLGLPPEPQRN